jgi:hypothetical protein
VPAVILFGRLPMAVAVGTSLAVIAANLFAGWLGHLGHEPFAWRMTGAFLLAALAGMASGAGLGGRLTSDNAPSVRLVRARGRCICAGESLIRQSSRGETETDSDIDLAAEFEPAARRDPRAALVSCPRISISKTPKAYAKRPGPLSCNRIGSATHLDHSHHAKIFVIEDMAMVYGPAREILKRDPHPHTSAPWYINSVFPSLEG